MNYSLKRLEWKKVEKLIKPPIKVIRTLSNAEKDRDDSHNYKASRGCITFKLANQPCQDAKTKIP